uniref:GDT1 family protein n=1 Tax=Globisporangium ultimum (strain ATCC 200006 / CBS 805.95 / DAOM BR144) TaxID=431595 RepID=K3WA02_GLOUD
MFMARSHFHLLLLAALLCSSDGIHAQVADATPEQLKPKVPTVVSDDAFDRADADHNGFLDAQEFASFTSSIKKALDPFLSIYSAGEGDDQPRGNDGGFGAPSKARLRGGGVNKFWSGFVSGILTIWATEIGDKTFFIAAILSMKQDRVVVFAGAIGALIVMTVLSVVMGVVATKFLPPHVTHYIGALLFIGFGAKMLYDSREMSATGPSEELSEVEEELMGKKTEEEAEQVEAGQAKPSGAAASDGMMQVFSQTFLMTFLAEWGDRSQIATVTLSATKDAFGVTLGAILGHSMCTGIAVIGGKFLATRISEKTVTLIGGALFVLFALHSFIAGPPEV